MKALTTSRRLEYSECSNTLCAHGSPLPRQGEGEGEGLSHKTCAARQTPHLDPLPFSKGRGERRRVWFGANLGTQKVAEMTRPPKFAINKRFGE